MPLTPEQGQKVRAMYDAQVAKDKARQAAIVAVMLARQPWWVRLLGWFK